MITSGVTMLAHAWENYFVDRYLQYSQYFLLQEIKTVDLNYCFSTPSKLYSIEKFQLRKTECLMWKEHQHVIRPVRKFFDTKRTIQMIQENNAEGMNRNIHKVCV